MKMYTKKDFTRKEMFTQIKTHLTNAEEIAFIEHEIELIEKKASGEGKPTITKKRDPYTLYTSKLKPNNIKTLKDSFKLMKDMLELIEKHDNNCEPGKKLRYDDIGFGVSYSKDNISALCYNLGITIGEDE